jgi:hypothetical protein
VPGRSGRATLPLELIVKKIIAGTAAALMLVAGCTSTPDPSYDMPGLVVDKARRSVTVRQDDGRTVRHGTSKPTARRCQIGERWPAC